MNMFGPRAPDMGTLLFRLVNNSMLSLNETLKEQGFQKDQSLHYCYTTANASYT